jgi:hypothetical protein
MLSIADKIEMLVLIVGGMFVGLAATWGMFEFLIRRNCLADGLWAVRLRRARQGKLDVQ